MANRLRTLSQSKHILGLLQQVKGGRIMRPITVTFEGNIASGKTTLLQHFKDLDHVKIYEEPVKEWRNINGENALSKLYSDPKRWSLALQTYVQLTMLKLHTAKQEEPIKLMERSIHSARHCFVENMYKTGNMTSMEYNILISWYDWILENEDVHSDLIVYVRTDPNILSERIQKRARTEEQTIPLAYLQQLHEMHEDWLLNKNQTIPVKVIDANQDLADIQKEIETLKSDLMQTLEQNVSK